MLVARNRFQVLAQDDERTASVPQLAEAQYETWISAHCRTIGDAAARRTFIDGRHRLRRRTRPPTQCAVPSLQADRTLELTLEDAVRRAVENNPDLAIVRLGTEVESARVGESQSAFAPVFSTMLGRSSSVTPPSNSLLGDRGVDVNDCVLVDAAFGSGCSGALAHGACRGTPRGPRPPIRSAASIRACSPACRSRSLSRC